VSDTSFAISVFEILIAAEPPLFPISNVFKLLALPPTYSNLSSIIYDSSSVNVLPSVLLGIIAFTFPLAGLLVTCIFFIVTESIILFFAYSPFSSIKKYMSLFWFIFKFHFAVSSGLSLF